MLIAVAQQDRCMNHEQLLIQTLKETPWFASAMSAVRQLHAPQAYIGSGAIRNAVWDALHGYETPSYLADIDVPYFDPQDLSEESEHRYARELQALEPAVTWDVKNQAAVHLWFHKVFGHEVAPIESIEHSVTTWPETACAVAVRLRPDEFVEVVAPLGLDDLFSMVVRRNPATRSSPETFEQRIADKRYQARWPMVRIVRE